MPQEIQQADPRLRRRVLLALVVASALAAVGLRYLAGYLGALEPQSEEELRQATAQALTLARAILGLVGVAGAALAVHLLHLSRRALAAGRFPPPGARVLSDTPVLTGAAARRTGRQGIALAVLLLGVGLAVLWSAERILRQRLDVDAFRPVIIEAE